MPASFKNIPKSGSTTTGGGHKLLIDVTHFLMIDDSHFLLIDDAGGLAPSSWKNQSKSSGSWKNQPKSS